jgi:hypothetical protein
MKKTLYTSFILLVISFVFHPCMGREAYSNLKATSATGTAVLLRMNLYKVYPTKSVIQDGTLTQFGDNYSNKIDGYDARKMSSPGENISLFRNDTDLIVERRQTIRSADTIFFRMWGMQKTNYSLQIVPVNLNGLTAYLIDNYLHTTKELDLTDTTEVPFSINSDAASSAQLRFKIIFSAFKKLTSIPFSYVSIGASNQNNEVIVNWKTANEMKLKNYFVERSLDNVNYEPIATVNAANSTSNTYKYTDQNPLTESSFYRIHSVDVNGITSYSEVVKVINQKAVSLISVYPNPVIGNTLNLKLSNPEAGTYNAIVYNNFGSVVLTHQFSCSAANAIVKLPVKNTISKGLYYLEISKPFKKKQVIPIVF